MIIRFKYGFEVNGFIFGWNKKDLYRLPVFINKRSYSLKKLNKININGKLNGYRVNTKPKTIKQLQELTEIINYDYVICTSDECPW